ncbi:MAG TPA: Asd/ArgC dimerization domain-containing protein [Patescibacteria group bacterium]|nr:Asd/ArgC dimerization domain-containing protein [Patescibacteria group bacterium]
MSTSNSTIRIAIVGAGSARGKELRDVLETDGFSSAAMRLFDEDIAIGTLTRAGDEAAVISAVDESSFEGVRLVFFAGRAEMAARHAIQASQAGARVIDLSEDPGLENTAPWIPALDPLLGLPENTEGKILRSPSAAVIVAASIAAALDPFRPSRLAMTFLRPVSERGQEGIDELEQQTVSLLSFRPISEGIFGAQVAFNLMDAYGAGGEPSLQAIRGAIVRDTGRALGGRIVMPALRIVQAPVFFSYAFSVYAELAEPVEAAELEAALGKTGLRVETESEPRPTNMSVTGRPEAVLGPVERDVSVASGYWFWGAADNVRMVAANAVAIARSLL